MPSKKYISYFILFLFIVSDTVVYGQDSSVIKVHFLYGSRPARGYKKTEPRWFGGILGGHVGVESNQNNILSFVPSGKFHVVTSKNNRHSKYTVDSFAQFYSRFGHQHPDSAKKAIVIIPVTAAQKQKFDSLAMKYLETTPYDYALVGMRCGAASYDLLAQLGILKELPLLKTYTKILYPKKLRKRLLARAEENGWQVIRQQGTSHRKWEAD